MDREKDGFPGATRVFFIQLPGATTMPRTSRGHHCPEGRFRASGRLIRWDEIAATWKFWRKFHPKFHPGGNLDSCWMNHFLDHFVHQKFWIQKSGGSSKESTSELHRFKSRWQIPLSCRYSKPKDTCGASQRIYPCP